MTRKIRHHLDSGTAPEKLTPKHLTKQEFGRRVYRLMLAKGWNQSELARQADLQRDSVSVYVRGKSLPTSQNLQKLAAALDVEPDELLPNYVESAVDEDNPSLEMRVSPARPTEAWLRVNRLVLVSTAAEVIRILNDDPLSKGEK